MTARHAITALLLAAFPKASQSFRPIAAYSSDVCPSTIFECGALAEYAEKPEETGRLYKLGYDQEKTLLDALRGWKGRSAG
jgi:hypothetical protein